MNIKLYNFRIIMFELLLNILSLKHEIDFYIYLNICRKLVVSSGIPLTMYIFHSTTCQAAWSGIKHTILF